MYKVLIAEDTSLIRRGIISMIRWEQYNCILAGEAENGKDAIKLLETLAPDIILLDVKMPYVDGMKVLDYITEKHIPVKVIIVSGYSNFEYVKHALRTNTIDYILKPIHAEELNQAIAKAVEQLNCSDGRANISREVMQKQRLIGLIEENIYSTFGDVFTSLPLPSYFWVASIKNKYNDYAFFKDRIKILISSSTFALFHEHPNRMDIIFHSASAEDYTSAIELMHRVYRLADTLIKNLLYIGISDLHASDYIVAKAYYESHKALCNKMLFPQQNILLFENFKHKNFSLEDVFQSEIPLLDFLLAGNSTDAISLCQKVIGHHLGRSDITLDEFCMLLTEFYCILSKTSSEYVSELQQEISSMHNLENLLNYDSTRLLIENLYRHCSNIAAESVSSRTDIESSISAIQKYIEQHFSEQINLKILENLFHLNGSYISVTFKKITGTGINKYIRKLRMDYAIKLLSTTDFKMSDICEKSGFTNYVHFSKEFKKHTGFSPSEYRQKIRLQ